LFGGRQQAVKPADDHRLKPNPEILECSPAMGVSPYRTIV
jgi:hypothetical protein